MQCEPQRVGQVHRWDALRHLRAPMPMLLQPWNCELECERFAVSARRNSPALVVVQNGPGSPTRFPHREAHACKASAVERGAPQGRTARVGPTAMECPAACAAAVKLGDETVVGEPLTHRRSGV